LDFPRVGTFRGRHNPPAFTTCNVEPGTRLNRQSARHPPQNRQTAKSLVGRSDYWRPAAGRQTHSPDVRNMESRNLYSFSRTVDAIADFIVGQPYHNRPFYRVHGLFQKQYTCPYCNSQLRGAVGRSRCFPIDFLLKVCPRCQWYRNLMQVWDRLNQYDSCAILTKHSVADDNVPIEELRAFLSKNWGRRKDISAAKCEELVSDIFRNAFDAEVIYQSNSVYAKDRGIDFVLVRKSDGIAMAFQVKRRQTDKHESVKCVREFIGALAQSPYDVGFYVTTAASFTGDAKLEYKDSFFRLKRRGLGISLIDGRRLREYLIAEKLASRAEQAFDSFGWDVNLWTKLGEEDESLYPASRIKTWLFNM